MCSIVVRARCCSLVGWQYCSSSEVEFHCAILLCSALPCLTITIAACLPASQPASLIPPTVATRYKTARQTMLRR